MENPRPGEAWDSVIRPRNGWFDIDFKGLVRYRDLILLFVKRVIEWSKGRKHLKKLGLFLEKKAAKNTPKVQRFEVFGLMLFVAIPLPMTGAWTGALVAALTGMKFKNAMISIIGGVLIAGAIVTLIVQGALGFLNFMIQ